MRRHKSAVPASKARVGEVYAVKYDDELTRFRVDKITTHKVSETGSPHDYESEITGYFIFEHDPVNGYRTEKAVIKPNMLLGQFEEYQELVAQRDHEKAVVEAKANAEKKVATDLVVLLYDVTGMPIPNDRYGRPFEVRYNSGVEISREGAKALLEKLRALKAK